MNTLYTLSRGAHKALAAKWFLLGFRLSGKGFHGENYDDRKYPSLVALLLSEFNRVYDAERASRENKRDELRAARSAARGNEGAK